MSKAASSPTKGTSSSKKATTSKSRTPVIQNGVSTPASPETSAESVALTVESPAPAAAFETPALASILQRLDTLEEKITGGFATLAEELRALNVAPLPTAAEPGATPEVELSLLTDVLRHNLMEHLTPVTAALKRLEERIGFVANRLKFSGGSSGGGQDRQKPWRGEQSRHARPPRGQQQNGQQRPTPPQPQQWTPPSAASVQGHFAPRPSPGRGFVEEDD